MKKTALKILIITFIISAILGISIILLNLWNDVSVKILLTTISIFGFSIPGLACSLNYEKSKDKLIPTLGIITCFVSCIYFLLVIWGIFNYKLLGEFLFEFMVNCILFSASFGHICLLLLINSSDKKVNYFKYGTISLSICMDLLILIEIYTEIELYWKIQMVIAILIVLGTIVTPLLNKLNSKTEQKVESVNDNKYLKLDQLKKLLDDKAITQEEYENEKNKILND